MHNCTNEVRLIKNVLSVALNYGNEVFDDKWVFQQDGAKSHRHYLTEEWCRDNFPSFIDKDRGNSPDLKRLDDSIRDELIDVINREQSPIINRRH